jgi:glycine/D-amino acid oxidase-like deaminating enzyme
MSASTFDVAVVGAGVMGATVALCLARGGMNVTLLDKGGICHQASGVNAGTLTMNMTRVALIPFALKGHAMWASASRWLGHDVGVQVCDGLSLAFTEREATVLAERAARRRAAGAPIELVDGKRAKRIEPGLSDHVMLAAFCAVDGFANAYLTGIAYRNALTEAGVRIMEHTATTGVHRATAGFVLSTSAGAVEARRLVLAGGVWLETMAEWFGLRIPIKVLINQLAVTARVPPVMRTVVGIASGLLSLKQFPHGTVVIGGGWQGLGDREHGATAFKTESLIGNVRLACHVIPALRGSRIVRAWLGLEAETADALPAIGPLPEVPDAFMIGSVHSGYTSGPYLAKLLADQMLGREPEMSFVAFDPARLLMPPSTDRRAAK